MIILVIYSAILYANDNFSKVGIVISVSIVCMDIFNWCLYRSDLVKEPGTIIALLIVNRILMVGLGEAYWVYGFMVLYLLYSLFFMI